MHVEGFVVPVRTEKKDDYIRAAKVVAEVYLEHGARRVMECWGDDVPIGEVTSFPRAIRLETDETACFSWVEWPDRATRDAGHNSVFEDRRLTADMMDGVISGKRMIWGGFVPIVDEGTSE